MVFIYPADYFAPKQHADDFFENERILAESFGANTVLIDYDSFAITSGSLSDDTVDSEIVVYRGWQMPPDDYENKLYPIMQRLGHPLTSPISYASLHEIDECMSHLADKMAKSVIVPYEDIYNESVLSNIFEELGNTVFVKDGTKSVYGLAKLELAEQGFAPVIEHLELLAQQRGDAFTDSFVFKEWLDIEEQVRIFVVDGQAVVFVPHDGYWSGNIPDNIPTDLPSRFYTVDMGYANNQWYIIEWGDGQVSECEGTDNQQVLYNALLNLEQQ